jgi:hypothetical protein
MTIKVIRPGRRAALCESDYVILPDQNAYEQLQYKNIEFELSEAGIVRPNVKSEIAQKKALGVANALRCLHESNPALLNLNVFIDLVESQEHAQNIAFALAAFPSLRYGGRQELQAAELTTLLVHAKNAEVIYKALWELRAIVAYRQPEVYINARSEFMRLLSLEAPQRETLSHDITMFLEGIRQNTKEFFNGKIRTGVASVGLVADHRLDVIDEKFTPGIALAVQQLQALPVPGALTQATVDTLLEHPTMVYSINNNLAHLQRESSVSLLEAFIHFLQQGAHMVSHTFKAVLNQFTRTIRPDLEPARLSQPQQGPGDAARVRFFTPPAAPSLAQQRLLSDHTPADPYGPGAIVSYTPRT